MALQDQPRIGLQTSVAPYWDVLATLDDLMAQMSMMLGNQESPMPEAADGVEASEHQAVYVDAFMATPLPAAL